MKKAFFSLVMVALLTLSACASPTGVGTTQPTSSDQVATVVAPTMQASPSNTPEPTPDPRCPLAVTTSETNPGKRFLNVNVTPQGQASAVVVAALN